MIAELKKILERPGVFHLVEGFPYPPDEPDQTANPAPPKSKDPQKKNGGYIQVPNELFEAIINHFPCRLPYSFLIFLAVMRETLGFHRVWAEISTDRFRKLTGIKDRHNIYVAVKLAVEMKLIKGVGSNPAKSHKYSINKDFTEWKKGVGSNPIGVGSNPAKSHKYSINKDFTESKKGVTSNPTGGWKQPHRGLEATPQGVASNPHLYVKDSFKDTSKDRESTPTALPRKKLARKRTRTALPQDFQLSEAMRSFAAENGIDGNQMDTVFGKFKDYHQAMGNLFVDWSSAWRLWVRNEKHPKREEEESNEEWAKRIAKTFQD